MAEADFTISLFNPAAEQHVPLPGGRRPSAAPGPVHPDDRRRRRPERFGRRVAEPGEHRDQGVRADGEVFPLEASVARTEAAGSGSTRSWPAT